VTRTGRSSSCGQVKDCIRSDTVGGKTFDRSLAASEQGGSPGNVRRSSRLPARYAGRGSSRSTSCERSGFGGARRKEPPRRPPYHQVDQIQTAKITKAKDGMRAIFSGSQRSDRRSVNVAGTLAHITSGQLECLPIQPDVRLHGNRRDEGSVSEAALLSDPNQARDIVPGLIGFDVDLHLETEGAAVNRAPQDGTLSEESDDLVDVDLLQLHLHHFP
jgi:hypothetical protein